MTFTRQRKTFTIVIDKCIKLGRSNLMRVPKWIVSLNWSNVSTWLILLPGLAGWTCSAVLYGFIFAMGSYLEHRGRDCHAGRYRFMNNSSRNCLHQCTYPIPIYVTTRHVYLSIPCALHGLVLVSGVGYRAKYFKIVHLSATDALSMTHNRPHVKRDLMRTYFVVS